MSKVIGQCVWCKKPITQKELNDSNAQELMGSLSHKSCDEDAFAKIDKRLKVVNKPDVFAED